MINEIALEEVSFAPEALETRDAQQLLPDPAVAAGDTLMLVRNDLPLPCGYEAQLVNYKDTTLLMNPDTARAFAALSAAVGERFGTKLYVESAYRTNTQQTSLFGDGNGADVCMPGASEHQTGLALDVYVENFAGSGFIQSPEGRFVNERCYEYGFIVRYPRGKQAETGIVYEPWHLRYVGLPHAEIMYKNGLTLEGYLESLVVGKFYRTGKTLISRQQGEVLVVPKGARNIVLSDDRRGNYVVTCTLL